MASMISFKASTDSPLKRPSTPKLRKTSALGSTVKKSQPDKMSRIGSVDTVPQVLLLSLTPPRKKKPQIPKLKINKAPIKPVEPQISHTTEFV